MPTTTSAERDLLNLSEQLLQRLGWSTETRLDRSFRARMPGGGAVAFGLDQSSNTVALVNDARRIMGESLQFCDIVQGALAGKTPEGQLRVGAELLLGGRDKARAQIKSYMEKLRASFDWAGASGCTGDLSSIELCRIDEINNTTCERTPILPRSLGVLPLAALTANSTGKNDGAEHPVRAVVALHAAYEGVQFILKNLIDSHVEALAAHDETAVCLPLLLSADDIRARGYFIAAVSAAPELLGEWANRSIVALLLRLGFLHPYVANAGRLRTGIDLDPNSRHIAEILANAGDQGGFTLCCLRGHVFHEPVFSGREPVPGTARPALRTLGQRFYQAPSLTLYDSSPPSPTSAAALAGQLDKVCYDVSITVAELAAGKLSQAESLRMLTWFAMCEFRANGGPVTVADIEGFVRQSMRGERSRAAQVDAIRTALLHSGAIAQIDANSFAMRSSVLRGWLIVKQLTISLANYEQYADSELFQEIMATRNLPYWVFRWTMDLPPIIVNKAFGETTLAPLANRYFVRPAKAGDIAAAENALNLVQAAISRYLALHKRADIEVATRWLIGLEGRKLYGLGLPQRTFSGMELGLWEFEECDLRNALFSNCDLNDAKFHNCVLAGAVMLDCQVSRQTEFRNCDLSGAYVMAVPDCGWSTLQASAFTDANLTSAEIRGPNVTVLMDRANEGGALTALFTARNTKNREILETVEDTAANAEFYAALAARAHAPQNGSKFAQILVTSGDDGHAQVLQDLTSIWARLEGESPPAGAKLQVDRHPAHKWVALFCPDGGLRLRHWRENVSFNAHKSNRGAAIAIDCLSLNGHGYAACVWERHFEVLSSGDLSAPPGGHAMNFRADEQASALHLIAGDSVGLAPAIAIGSNLGTLHFRTFAGQDAGQIDLGFDNAIVAIGSALRGDIVVAIQANGLVTGLRRVRDGAPKIIYRFQAAITDVGRLIPLNRLGQVMIVGANQGSRPRESLCILVGSAGAVAAVFPREEAENAYPLPFRLAGSSEGAVRGDPAAAMRGVLNSFEPDLPHVTVRPIADSTVTIKLKNTGNERVDDGVSGVEGLSESFIQDGLLRHRTIELDLEEADEEGNLLRGRTYLESDLKLDEHRNVRVLRIRFANRYRRSTKTAQAKLSIGYAGEPEVRRTWNVGVEVEWEDNPFTGDGIPVSGDRFFGMRSQLGALLTQVRETASGIVTSRRRAGKTSFLIRAAEMLRNPSIVDFDLAAAAAGRQTDNMEAIKAYQRQDPLVSVVVSAENMGDWGEDFVPAIAQKLEETYRGSDQPGLANLSRVLSGRKNILALTELGGALTRLGLAKPLVIFVDEWGHLRLGHSGSGSSKSSHEVNDRFVTRLTSAIPALQSAGIVLVASSVPADFPAATTESMSNLYRYLKIQIDLEPMTRAEVEDMIKTPLNKRGWSIEADVIEAVVRLSSGSPDDVNRLMHLAFKTAQAAQAVAGQDNTPRRTISAAHFDSELSERILVDKYDQQQKFLAGNFEDPKVRRKHLSDSLLDPPPWDRTEIPIPITETLDPYHLRRFADTGYRRKPTTLKDVNWALWIPWGLTLCLRRLARQEEIK